MDNPSGTGVLSRLRQAAGSVNTDPTGEILNLPPINPGVNTYCTFLVTPWSVPGGSSPWRR